MKFLRLILALAPALRLTAQTNLPVPELPPMTNAGPAIVATNTPAKENSPIRIASEHAEVDLKNHGVVYSGHVVVTNIQMKMTCDKLTASAPTNTTQIDTIVAEGNVKIVGADSKGRPVNARGDKAIYVSTVLNSVTNKTITLTGNVYVDSAMGKGTADPIVWDLLNDTIHMENQDMQIQPDIKLGTNSSLPFGGVEKKSP